MPTSFTSVRTECASTNPPMMLWNCGQKASTGWRSWKRRTKLSFVQKEWKASASCCLQFTRRCLLLHSEDLFQYTSTVVVPIRGHKPVSNSDTITVSICVYFTAMEDHYPKWMTLACVRVHQHITIFIIHVSLCHIIPLQPRHRKNVNYNISVVDNGTARRNRWLHSN